VVVVVEEDDVGVSTALEADTPGMDAAAVDTADGV
jgi:hypothetical protein